MNERDLIEYIRQLSGSAANSGIVQGIGDDCAVVEKDQETVWLLTMDTLIESVHFDCSWHPPQLLGKKAVAVNASDIAAMGGRPVFALLSLGLPASFDTLWAKQLNQGISQACQRYGCLLIGGDTVCSPERISLTLTVIGEMKREDVLYRHTAQPGDTVWVSGPLGLSAAGLSLLQAEKNQEHPEQHDPAWQRLIQAHLDPQARIGLAQVLAQSGLVHGMMDLSDGLATDLAHLCEQSGVGAKIRAEQIPGRDILLSAAEFLGQKEYPWMIAGGEDYELLFTAPSAVSKDLMQLATTNEYSIYPVGRIVEGQGVTLLKNRERDCGLADENISFRGYDHFKQS